MALTFGSSSGPIAYRGPELVLGVSVASRREDDGEWGDKGPRKVGLPVAGYSSPERGQCH